jgi:hypothetical protein
MVSRDAYNSLCINKKSIAWDGSIRSAMHGTSTSVVHNRPEIAYIYISLMYNGSTSNKKQTLKDNKYTVTGERYT